MVRYGKVIEILRDGKVKIQMKDETVVIMNMRLGLSAKLNDEVYLANGFAYADYKSANGALIKSAQEEQRRRRRAAGIR